MDHLDQAGGGTDLLTTPAVDVAVKVYRGGGLDLGKDLDLDLGMSEADKSEAELGDTVGGAGQEVEFTGITGKPVKRHQVSLLNTPKHRVQLKVYRGGGMEAKFRGEGIEKFKENPRFYASILATGEYYLKGTASLELKGETKEELSETLKGFNIFIYGKDTSSFDEKDLFETQLILFSTVLSPGNTAKEAPGTIGIFLLEVEGDKWTLKLPGSAEAGSETGAEAEEKVEPKAEEKVEPKVEEKVEPKVEEKSGAEATGAEIKDSIILGPYWVRDPEGLNADEFFEHLVDGSDSLAKSERLYLNDIVFKGYPLESLKGILSEKKEEFFTQVWKPLIKERVIDGITFQLNSEVRSARDFLEKLYNDKVEDLNKNLAKYLHGDTELEAEGAEPEAKETEAKEPEVKGPEVKEDKPEVKEDEEDKVEEEEEGEGEEEGEEEEEEEEEGEEEEEEEEEEEVERWNNATTSCDRLLEDKSRNKYIVYIKNIYTELKSFPHVNKIIEETLIELEKIHKRLTTIVIPLVEVKHVALVKDGLNNVAGEHEHFNSSLDTLIRHHKNKGKDTRATKAKEGKLLHDLHEAYDTLAESICSVYANLLKAGPSPRGGRRTRKLPKPSHSIQAKHNKQTR